MAWGRLGRGVGERRCSQPWAEHKSDSHGLQGIEILGDAETCEHKTWGNGEVHIPDY